MTLFLQAIEDAQALINSIMSRTMPLDMTAKEEEEFEAAEVCYMCRKPFEDIKVRDHCHFTGEFLGAAHQYCNLMRRKKFKIPIYAHNFSGYDSHFLMQAIANSDHYLPKLSAMVFNSQKIRSLSFGSFQFLDSMQFVSESLEKVTNDLSKSGHKFPILKNSRLYETEEQRQLLLRKGVFPYEYLKSIRQFEKMREFPPRKAFYSKLYEKHISESDYAHGAKVFEEFKCKNMLEYLQLYNDLDVFLLLEAISAFRDVGMKEIKLDLCGHQSLPQFGFQG